MIVGLVSDAHGNADALEKCLDVIEREGARKTYFLGDAVGYFPEENAVLDLLRSRGAICLRGNHEAMLLGKLLQLLFGSLVFKKHEGLAACLLNFLSLATRCTASPRQAHGFRTAIAPGCRSGRTGSS